MRGWYAAASLLPLIVMSASGAKAAEPGNSVQLDEVIVTAQKRTENLQDTPIAMAALNGADLREAGRNDFESLLQSAPSVRIANAPAGTQVFMRGLGPAVTTDASVSLNFDGVYQSDQIVGRIYDIARVEVLRGPQGTLYGRNATGGSVNFVSAAPDLERLSAFASLQVGNFNAIRAEGMINAPVSDKVALRAAFMKSEHDAYFNNGSSLEDMASARLKVLVEPTDAISILLAGSHTEADQTPFGTTTLPLSLHPSDPWVSTAQKGRLKYQRSDIYAQTNIDLGFGTLTWIPSYSRDQNRFDQDPQVTGLSAGGGISKQHTEEVRLSSNPSSPVSWLVGAYYLDRDYHRNRRSSITSGPRSAVVYPFVDTILQSTNSKAVFTQATAPVPVVENLRVTVGLRYSEDEQVQLAQAFSNATTPLATVPARRTTGQYDATNWKVGLEYDITPDNLLYGHISTGYKSGGLNEARPALLAGAIPVPSKFDPEEVTAYEIGSKNQFGALRLNLAAYYYDYQNQQILNIVIAGGVFLREVFNAAQSTIYGVELDARYALGPDTTIHGDLAYTDSSYDKFSYFSMTNPIFVPGAGTTLDYSGRRQPHAPEWSGSVGAEHVFHIGEGTLTASGEIRFFSEILVGLEPTAFNVQDPYTQSDARLTYTAPNGKLSLTGFVNNIENEAAKTSTLLSGAAVRRAYISAPRTYGLRLAVNY